MLFKILYGMDMALESLRIRQKNKLKKTCWETLYRKAESYSRVLLAVTSVGRSVFGEIFRLSRIGNGYGTNTLSECRRKRFKSNRWRSYAKRNDMKQSTKPFCPDDYTCSCFQCNTSTKTKKKIPENVSTVLDGADGQKRMFGGG